MAKGRVSSKPRPKVVWQLREIDGQPQWSGFFPLLPNSTDLAWAEIEAKNDDRWVGYWFRVTFDRGAVVSFDVRRLPDAPPLRAAMLQAVPLGAIEDAARAATNGAIAEFLKMRPWSIPGAKERAWIAEFDAPGEPSDRDHFLAKVALLYVQTIGDKNQRRTIHETFDTDIGYVPELIRDARRRDLLTPTTRGRAGGNLTAKAIQLLVGKSAVEILVEKLCWPEPYAKEMVERHEEVNELWPWIMTIAGRDTPDPEVMAAGFAAADERERRFADLVALVDSGEITMEEWTRRYLALVESTTPR
jgi:hypothetical protein